MSSDGHIERRQERFDDPRVRLLVDGDLDHLVRGDPLVDAADLLVRGEEEPAEGQVASLDFVEQAAVPAVAGPRDIPGLADCPARAPFRD